MRDPRRKQSIGAYAIHVGSTRKKRRRGDEDITAVTRICEQVGDQIDNTQEGARAVGQAAERLQRVIREGSDDEEPEGD